MIVPSRTRTHPTGGFGRHAGNAKSPCAMASNMKLAMVGGASVIPGRLLRLRCEARSCLLGDLGTRATRWIMAPGVLPLARHAHHPPILVFQDLLHSALEMLAIRGRDLKPEGVVAGW